METEELAKKAFDFLNNRKDTPYFNDKHLIKKVFKATRDNNKDDIIHRLILIDSLYSTQMNRRYFGIDELAERLEEINLSEVNDFIDNKKESSHSKIDKLFNGTYGFDKLGNRKKAFSLITKYFYFLTNENFPIYDSLVIENAKYFFDIKQKINESNFFEKFRNFRLINYSEIDNLLWLFGKIRTGNVSLILTKKEFEKIIQSYENEIKDLLISEKLNVKPKSKDTLISNWLKENWRSVKPFSEKTYSDFFSNIFSKL